MASPLRVCPHCANPVDAHQEICLECGERLAADPRPGLAPGLGWVRPAAAALLVAVVAGAVSITVANGPDRAAPVVAPPLGTATTTTPPTTATPTTTAPPASTATRGTTTATRATTTAPPTTTARTTTARTTTAQPTTSARPATTAPPVRTTPTTPTRPAGDGLTAWPPDRNGYTVVLASLPGGGPAALAQARARALAAARAGLPQTGVLRSDGFASLHPGYDVVFSGIYRTQAEAQRAAAAAQSRVPGAYPRQITR